jgi:hypothetical protein
VRTIFFTLSQLLAATSLAADCSRLVNPIGHPSIRPLFAPKFAPCSPSCSPAVCPCLSCCTSFPFSPFRVVRVFRGPQIETTKHANYTKKDRLTLPGHLAPWPPLSTTKNVRSLSPMLNGISSRCQRSCPRLCPPVCPPPAGRLKQSRRDCGVGECFPLRAPRLCVMRCCHRSRFAPRYLKEPNCQRATEPRTQNARHGRCLPRERSVPPAAYSASYLNLHASRYQVRRKFQVANVATLNFVCPKFRWLCPESHPESRLVLSAD